MFKNPSNSFVFCEYYYYRLIYLCFGYVTDSHLTGYSVRFWKFSKACCIQYNVFFIKKEYQSLQHFALFNYTDFGILQILGVSWESQSHGFQKASTFMAFYEDFTQTLCTKITLRRRRPSH